MLKTARLSWRLIFGSEWRCPPKIMGKIGAALEAVMSEWVRKVLYSSVVLPPVVAVGDVGPIGLLYE